MLWWQSLLLIVLNLHCLQELRFLSSAAYSFWAFVTRAVAHPLAAYSQRPSPTSPPLVQSSLNHQPSRVWHGILPLSCILIPGRPQYWEFMFPRGITPLNIGWVFSFLNRFSCNLYNLSSLFELKQVLEIDCIYSQLEMFGPKNKSNCSVQPLVVL